jgi:SprT protein
MIQLERNKAVLKKYIPESAVDTIAGWVYTFDFKLKIKKSRASKYGDYRPPIKGQNHQITINHDLNRYAFLITLVHEIAHLSAWKKFGDNILSHGKEWKQEYRILLQPFLNEATFPADIITALKNYISDPAASVCNDNKLFRVLNKYNENPNGLHLIEDLPLQAIFETTGNEKFIKQKKIRTRYLCTKISTKEEYLFHGLQQVKHLPEASLN